MSQTAPYLFQEEVYRLPATTIVIVSSDWNSMPDDEKALMAKILSSVRVNLASVTILAQSSTSIEKLKTHNPSRILIFGSNVQPEVKPYECVQSNGFSVIRADALSKLDDARKKSLWLALRQMFGV